MKKPGRESHVDPAGADVLAALEPDQLVARRQPVPRRSLKPLEVFTLWILRLYLMAVMGVLIYQVVAGSH